MAEDGQNTEAPKRQRSETKKSPPIKRASSPKSGKTKSPRTSATKAERDSLTPSKKRKSLPSTPDPQSLKKKKTSNSQEKPTRERKSTVEKKKTSTRSRKSADDAKTPIEKLIAKEFRAYKRNVAALVKKRTSLKNSWPVRKNGVKKSPQKSDKSKSKTNKKASKLKKTVKTPTKKSENDSDDDSDVLYSLVDKNIDQKCSVLLPKRNLLVTLANGETCSTVSTDSEISFKPAFPLIPALPKGRLSYPEAPTTLRSPLTNINGTTPEIPADSSAPLLALAGLAAGQPPNSPPPPRYESLLKSLIPKTGSKKKQSVDHLLLTDDSQRRLSVRQSESSFKYKEIIVKRANGYTQVSLDTQTKCKNALNPRVLNEIVQVLHAAKYDDSALVLLTGSGNVFCSGVDLCYLLGDEVSSAVDKRQCVYEMAKGIREFISALIQFPKPLVAAVNGPAVGLGMALLPLCDIVYASDKATFSCPYTRLGQTPEGGASLTLPQTMGLAMSSEVLMACRKITAMEASQCGLVSQVFWPTAFMQEVIPRLQQMVNTPSTTALEATKLLVRSQHRSRIEQVVNTESQMLTNLWLSPQCQASIREYLANDNNL